MSSRGNSSPVEQTPFFHSGFDRRQVDVEESAQNMQENTPETLQSVNAGRQSFVSVPTQATGHRNNSGFSDFIEAEAENVSISPVTQNGGQHVCRLNQTPVNFQTRPGHVFSQIVGGSTRVKSTTETNRAQFVHEKPCDFQQNDHQNQFRFANAHVRRTPVPQTQSATQTSQFVQAERPSLSPASQFVKEVSNCSTSAQKIHQNNHHFARNVVPFLQETVVLNEPQNWFAAKQNVRHENVVKLFKTWSMVEEHSQFVDVESVSSPVGSEENYDNSQFFDEGSLGSPFGSTENDDDAPFFDEETLASATALIKDAVKKITEYLTKRKLTSSEQNFGDTFSQNNEISTQSLPIMQEKTTQTPHFVKVEETPIEQTLENGHQQHQVSVETSRLIKTEAEEVSIELSNKCVQTETHFVKVEEMPIEATAENGHQNHIQFVNKAEKASQQEGMETSQFDETDTEDETIDLSNTLIQTETNQAEEFTSSEHKFSQNNKVLNQSLPIMKENTTQTSLFVKIEEMSIEPSAENGLQNYVQIVNKSEKVSQQEGMETSPFDEADAEDETIELSNTLIQTETNQAEEFISSGPNVGNVLLENGILNLSLPIMKENTTQTSHFVKVEEMPFVSIELSTRFVQSETNQIQPITSPEHKFGIVFSQNNKVLNQSLPIMKENTTQTSHFIKLEEMSIEPSVENGLQNDVQFVNKSEEASQQGMETPFDETDTEDETIELSNTLIQTATNQAQEFSSTGQNVGNVFLENNGILNQSLSIMKENTTQTSHFVKVEEMSIELEAENYSELNNVQVETSQFVRAEAENISSELSNRFVETETNQIQTFVQTETNFVKVEEMPIEASAENGLQNYVKVVNKSEKASQQGMETSPFDEADAEDETIELSNTLIQTATNQVQEFTSTVQNVGNVFLENNGILNQFLPIMKENTTQTSHFVKVEDMPIEPSGENGLQNHIQFVNKSENVSQQEGMETSQFDETDTEDETTDLSNTLIQTEKNQVQEFTSTAQNVQNEFSENNDILNHSLQIMKENTTQTSHFVKVEEMPIEPAGENGLQNYVQTVNKSEKTPQEEEMETSQFDEADTEDETIELSNTLIQTKTNQAQEFTSTGQNVGNMFLENNNVFNQSFPIKQDNTTQTSHFFKVEEMPIELETESYSLFNEVQETSQFVREEAENVSSELSNRFVQTETNREQNFVNILSQNNDNLNQTLQIEQDTSTQTSNIVEVEETQLEPNIEIGHFPQCLTTDNNKSQEILNVPQPNQEFTSAQQNPQNYKRKSQSDPQSPSNNPEIVRKAARIVKENATENCTFVNNECLESRKNVDEVNNDVTVCNSPSFTNEDGFAERSNNFNILQETVQTHKSSNQSSKSPDDSELSHKEGSFCVTRHGTFNSIQVKHNLDFDFSDDVADFAKYYAKIVNTLEDATRKSLVYAKRGDKIQLELRNPKLKNTVSVILGDENDPSCLSALLDRLGEANAEANTEANQLEMVVQIVQVRAGGGKRKCDELEELIEKKRKYLYLVRNHDNQLCFAISLAHVLHPGSSDSEATRLGAELQRKAGLSDQTPVTFGDVAKFERLTNRKIIVFYREENAKTLNTFMTSFERTETPPVYLYLQHSHYVGVKNIQAFVGKNFCEHCFQTYNSSKTHFCAKHCPICLDPGCDTNESKRVVCQDCYHKCRSNYCYEAHKKPRWRPNAKVNASECDRSKRCRLCKCTYVVPLANVAKNQPFEHKCPVKVCATCGDKMDKREHECYVLPLESVKNNSETNLIFYEFKSYATGVRKHVPFVLSAKTLRGKTWTAYGERCIVEFLLHFKSKAFNGTTFISHRANSSILLANMTEIGENTSVIMQGGKIVCIELPDRKQKFVDAASFLPMPLAALPETFGFSTYKGFFPVRFISKENLQYVGKCPAPEFYAVELMNDKKRQDFEEAYQLASIGEFNFKREAQIYCEDDVDILTTACVKLRTFFINRYNVDPFSCASLKAFGMRVFCTKFLAATTLAIPPFYDYKPNRKTYTDASIEWLEWVMFSEKIFIQHALNKGVKQLKKGVYVDGYSEADGQRVAWEFVSCSQNFCPVCFPSADQGERHRICEEELEKLANLRNVKLVVMREHNWNKMKQSDAKIEEFLKRYEKPQPLTLQELANGSLNGVVKLRHSAGPDEEIRFAQVNSLFPYVVANQPYPIGHPGRIFEKFGDIQSYFGLIKAVVYPPRALFLPFLPYKTANGKTVFTLCRTCDHLNNQQGACDHNDDERALTGVWVTPEFDKALQLGYKVGKIVEVWHFEQKSNTIFEEFVNSFVKGKQESSGFHSKPANLAKTHIYERCLDEFWKGFGDRNPQLKTEIVSKDSDLVKMIFSDEFKVEYFKILGINTALVQWTQEKSPPEKTDNVFVTAFAAAYARLHLYNVLEKLQEKVLYFDEDQVVYVAKHGQNDELEFGGGLGQLTDKLAGERIREFASTGLKSYAFQTTTKRVVMNVKGITRTLEKCERINFSVKDVVKGFSDENNRESIKVDLKSVYDQRRLLQNGNTLPFGY